MPSRIPLFVALVLPLLPTAAAPDDDVARAWPRIIMFYGGPLTRRIYLTRSDEIPRFMGAVNEPAQQDTARSHERPYVDVALFWHDPTNGRYLRDSTALGTLQPQDAQPARLLPAHRELPPMFDYHSALSRPGLRGITPEGLAILTAHGVPTRLD